MTQQRFKRILHQAADILEIEGRSRSRADACREAARATQAAGLPVWPADEGSGRIGEREAAAAPRAAEFVTLARGGWSAELEG